MLMDMVEKILERTAPLDKVYEQMRICEYMVHNFAVFHRKCQLNKGAERKDLRKRLK